MPDDAFALSPISARASMPTEADYEAICGAFMETARGRWFLGEYAKRNRNTDTRMVLAAIARIEATMASQKAAASHSLAEHLPDIAELIADARRRVLEALPKNDMRPATEPIQRAAGILRDVAWTLRESGADTRVCDLLDVQAKAIVDGCTRMHGDQAAPDVPAAVTAALDLLTRRISALAKADAPQAKPPDQAEQPAEVSQVQPQPVPPQAVASSPAEALDVVAPDEPPATPQPTAEAAEMAEAPVTREAAEQAPAPLTPVEIDLQASLQEGLEITEIDPDRNLTVPGAAAEPALAEAPPVTADAKVAELAPAVQDATAPIVDDAPSAAPDVAAQEPVAAAEPEVAQKPAPTSLGQAALAGGIVASPRSRYSEALAPIRRMSQAEKIAFFS